MTRRHLSSACWFLSLALLAAATASASDGTPARARVAVARDDLHAAGSVAIVGRYGGDWGVTAAYWSHDSAPRPGEPRFAAGGDYTWTWSNWRYGGGAVWIDRTNGINGTRWNFELLLAYDFSPRIYAELTHYSHGSELGIRKDLPNWGWNFLGVGVAF